MGTSGGGTPGYGGWGGGGGARKKDTTQKKAKAARKYADCVRTIVCVRVCGCFLFMQSLRILQQVLNARARTRMLARTHAVVFQCPFFNVRVVRCLSRGAYSAELHIRNLQSANMQITYANGVGSGGMESAVHMSGGHYA